MTSETRISRDAASSNPPHSATESLSLGIPRSNHRIARPSGLICKYVVAEKVTFRQMTHNSRPESLLANLARPFGSCDDGRRYVEVSGLH